MAERIVWIPYVVDGRTVWRETVWSPELEETMRRGGFIYYDEKPA